MERVGAQRLCIHGRTLRQRYSGIADWETIQTAVRSVDVPVVANGDITDAQSAQRCLELTNASGLMIGRAAIGRPDVFAHIKVGLGWMEEEELPWVIELDEDWSELSETSKAFAARRWCWDRYITLCRETTGLAKQTMQRHAIAFSKGLPGAKSVRTLMHELSDVNEAAKAISDFLKPISEG